VTMSESSMAAAAGNTGGVIVTLVQMEPDVRDELTRFYSKEMRAFIEKQGGKGCAIAERSNSTAMFDNLKTLLPEAIHPLVNDLESICEEKRELDRQIVLHRDAAPYSSGPLSTVHSFTGRRCDSCHTPIVQAGFLSVGFRKHVTDQACLGCHQAPEHQGSLQTFTPSCASCHTEHIGSQH